MILDVSVWCRTRLARFCDSRKETVLRTKVSISALCGGLPLFPTTTFLGLRLKMTESLMSQLFRTIAYESMQLSADVTVKYSVVCANRL